MNQFGIKLRLTTFGESHGKGVGGVLDGFPSSFPLDLERVQEFLSYRRPGFSSLVSTRRERDEVEFLSGLLEDGTTTGAPIAFFVPNTDVDSSAYEEIQTLFRPSHADFTYFIKYKLKPQPGGGRSSARETAVRCIAGAIALQWLAKKGIKIYSYVSQVGNISLDEDTITEQALHEIYSYPTRCPSHSCDEKIQQTLQQIAKEGDSLGGVVSTRVKNMPTGIGEPLYDKLSSRLGYAMLSINATKGFEIGDGFSIASMRGSEANDAMELGPDGEILFNSNHAGGILGGISTGQDLTFRVAFKPTPSISLPQHTVSIDRENTTIQTIGRHDPAVVIRAVPVVEAMTALVLTDFLLQMD